MTSEPDRPRDATPPSDAAGDALRGDPRLWDLLGAYPDEPVPEGFSDRVLSTVRTSPGSSWRLLPGRARAVAAAALVLAVGAGVLVGRSGGGPSRRVPSPALSVVEALPAELLEREDLETLAGLSDDAFEILLAADPDDLAGERGG